MTVKYADIIVSKNGRAVVVEIKDGNQPPSKQKLTDGEVKFMNNWQGEYAIVNCVDAAIAL